MIAVSTHICSVPCRFLETFTCSSFVPYGNTSSRWRVSERSFLLSCGACVPFLWLLEQVTANLVAYDHTNLLLSFPEIRGVGWVSLGSDQGVSRDAFLLEALGGSLCSCLFWLLEAAHIPCLALFHLLCPEWPAESSSGCHL